jgi:DNA-binding NarL/FixJ family response regulator
VVTLFPIETASAEMAAAATEAWELVRDRPPSAIRAKILALRAREWAWYGGAGLETEELEQLAHQARAAAFEVGAEEVAIDALVTLAIHAEWRDRFDEAVALGRAAAAQAAAIGAYNVELRALNNLTVNYVYRGLLRESIAIAEEIVERAKEVGLTWSEVAIEARINVLGLRFDLGERAADDPVDDYSAAPEWAALRMTAANLLPLAIAGRFDEVDATAARILARSDDARTIQRVRFALAEAALWRGELTVAVEQTRQIIEWLEDLPRAGVAGARLAGAMALAAYADMAEQAWRRGDESAARDAIGDGERLHDRVMSHGKYALESQWRMEMRNRETVAAEARMYAELGRLRGENDAQMWRAVVTSADQLKYQRTLARWRLAEVLIDDGRRDEAAAELQTAHADAVHMGASPLRAAVEALARRSRIALPGVAPDSDDLLTPRERAVLELVASGLTNRQVGEELYISEKTASVHLSRVMAKLGAGSRTEAVSLAYERGLLE